MMLQSHIRFSEKGVATHWSFDQPPPVNSALGPPLTLPLLSGASPVLLSIGPMHWAHLMEGKAKSCVVKRLDAFPSLPASSHTERKSAEPRPDLRGELLLSHGEGKDLGLPIPIGPHKGMGAVERFHIAEPKGSTSVCDRSMSHRLVPAASKSTCALCSGSLIRKIELGAERPEKEVKLESRMIGGNYLVTVRGNRRIRSVGESLALSNIQGIGGSIPPMSSHGPVPPALFLCVGVIYDRHKT
ncbi:hypothetical protein IFM89_020581 [Coptis chinensis]|uniref:Uncharacterized protein n=1 Tax=Coptis chinensis TaxID=261450 RepID=A0A835IDU4_9MAGN|nr:hypothetical protein IFM89_020581 [Coptis chinensis]